MHVLIYLSVLILCSLYASVRGGTPERLGVAILIGAIIASHFAPASGVHRFQQLETGLLTVDAVMFACVVALALRAQRYWPMWMAAILLDTLVTHLLMLSPPLMPWSYSVMIAAWSYPHPLLLAVAAWRHRNRVVRYGSDPAWST